jgi:hypothetical protein
MKILLTLLLFVFQFPVFAQSTATSEVYEQAKNRFLENMKKHISNPDKTEYQREWLATFSFAALTEANNCNNATVKDSILGNADQVFRSVREIVDNDLLSLKKSYETIIQESLNSGTLEDNFAVTQQYNEYSSALSSVLRIAKYPEYVVDIASCNSNYKKYLELHKNLIKTKRTISHKSGVQRSSNILKIYDLTFEPSAIAILIVAHDGTVVFNGTSLSVNTTYDLASPQDVRNITSMDFFLFCNNSSTVLLKEGEKTSVNQLTSLKYFYHGELTFEEFIIGQRLFTISSEHIDTANEKYTYLCQ